MTKRGQGQTSKAQRGAEGQRSKSVQLQKERERKERQQRIQANHDRIASTLLLKLQNEVLSEGVDISGWTVTFDIERITGHPEGERTGQPLNTRDKSIRYVSPEGQAFKTRKARSAGPGWEEQPVTPSAVEWWLAASRTRLMRRESRRKRACMPEKSRRATRRP